MQKLLKSYFKIHLAEYTYKNSDLGRLYMAKKIIVIL